MENVGPAADIGFPVFNFQGKGGSNVTDGDRLRYIIRRDWRSLKTRLREGSKVKLEKEKGQQGNQNQASFLTENIQIK